VYDADRFLRPVHNLLNGIGHGLRGHGGNLLPAFEQCIDEAAFPCLYFPYDDKHKGVIYPVAQLAHRLSQGLVADVDRQFVQGFDGVVCLRPQRLQALVEQAMGAGHEVVFVAR
jgi:hypothetical protein